jgi:single-strand DNA-binding protein
MRTNSVQLIGYVGQDLSEKTLPSGDKKVSLRVATTHSFKDKDGKVNYSSAWHDVIAWDAVAEYAGNNFLKGSKILVEGTIVYRTYPDHHGHTRYVTEIKATSLQNLDR